MGIIQHHAIIAVTWSNKAYKEMLQWIKQLSKDDQNLFLIQKHSVINAYRSIVMCPDGSKEGWTESDEGDLLRKDFKFALKKIGRWQYVEISFGDYGKHFVR